MHLFIDLFVKKKWHHNISVESISTLLTRKSYLRFVVELALVAFRYVDTSSEWNKWLILHISPAVMPQ